MSKTASQLASEYALLMAAIDTIGKLPNDYECDASRTYSAFLESRRSTLRSLLDALNPNDLLVSRYVSLCAADTAVKTAVCAACVSANLPRPTSNFYANGANWACVVVFLDKAGVVYTASSSSTNKSNAEAEAFRQLMVQLGAPKTDDSDEDTDFMSLDSLANALSNYLQSLEVIPENFVIRRDLRAKSYKFRKNDLNTCIRNYKTNVRHSTHSNHYF